MAAKKKAAKKVTKKVVKKPAVKGVPFSKTVCELITAGKLSKEEISKKISKEYPGVKFNGLKAVNYYINFITLGKMIKVGFEADSVPEMHRKSKAPKAEIDASPIDEVEEEAGDDNIPTVEPKKKVAKKKAAKKVAKKKSAKKVAKRK